MIIQILTDYGKATFVQSDQTYCFPFRWHLSATDVVTITALDGSGISLTAPIANMHDVDDVVIPKATLIQILTEKSGFKSATGGSVALSTAQLTRTGQTDSYYSGDDGDVRNGAGTDWFTLNKANIFGNFFKFTDELGLQTYANGIMINHQSADIDAGVVVGYSMSLYDDNISHEEACILAQLKTPGGFGNWHVCNEEELHNIAYRAVTSGTVLNYPPLNIMANMNVWSGTTVPLQPANAYLLNLFTGDSAGVVKTANGPRYMISRIFTITNSTLS